MRNWTGFLLGVGLWVGAHGAVRGAEEAPLFRDRQAPVEARVDDLLGRLTLEEKVALCHGNFASGGVPRLGIGALQMLDGRQGLRPHRLDAPTSTTLLPCALALSCTWDEKAAQEFGRVLAEEMLALDKHVLLAPMLNLVRSPLGGRNFENFGEDPFLVGRIGSAYIRGVQEQGVGACSCLLVANDSEKRRHFTSSNMDERTLRELHLVGYEMSVREGKVWSMMTGNNLFNGVYCAQDRGLLQERIKDEFGFDGVMITDWRAAYETTPTALAGTDMTTGFCSYVFGQGRLLAAVKEGQVSEALLDDKARRVLRLYVRSGVLDPESRRPGGLDTPEHREAARRLAAEAMVLLKNDRQVLPLEVGRERDGNGNGNGDAGGNAGGNGNGNGDGDGVRRILVTGPAADRVIQGGGSGHVPAAVRISPLDGLRNALGEKSEIVYLPFEAPLQGRMEKGSVEWESPGAKKKGRRKKRAGGAVAAPARPDRPSTAALARAAGEADAVIFVAAGLQASEGRDLPDMELPGGQAEAIAAVAEANRNVVVVLVANGAVSLEGWGERVPAILAVHYAGQATGDALADVVTGRVNPGGKLSYTFARRLEDYPVHALGEWPARLILDRDPVDPGMTPETRKPTHAFSTEYREGVFGGYRWFDEKAIAPRFPFGHGLSYTTFELSGLRAERSGEGEYRVTCRVKNTGRREGSEVVQVYVAPPEQPESAVEPVAPESAVAAESAVPRPPRELKGFAKVSLKPGESREVSVELAPRAFAYYDAPGAKWRAEAGDYEIQVGTSSRDLRLRTRITLPEDILVSDH